MRAQLGDHLWFFLYTGAGTDAPQDPDAAPTISIIDDTAAVYGPYTMPPIFPRITGMFAYEVFLGDNSFRPFSWTTGQKIAIMRWTVATVQQAEMFHFRIMPGGHVDGAILAMGFYNRPEAKHVIQQLQSGKIIKGTNPRF